MIAHIENIDQLSCILGGRGSLCPDQLMSQQMLEVLLAFALGTMVVDLPSVCWTILSCTVSTLMLASWAGSMLGVTELNLLLSSIDPYRT